MTQFSSRLAERHGRAGIQLILMLAAVLPFFSLARADELSEKVWIHGSANCAENRDPPIETFQFDPDTYILRQNNCTNFEGPFIYLMFGQHEGRTLSVLPAPGHQDEALVVYDDRSDGC